MFLYLELYVLWKYKPNEIKNQWTYYSKRKKEMNIKSCKFVNRWPFWVWNLTYYTRTKNWGVKSDYVPNLLGSITINMVTISSGGASHVRITHGHSAENIIQAVHVVLNSVIYYTRWYFSDYIDIFQILCYAMF